MLYLLKKKEFRSAIQPIAVKPPFNPETYDTGNLIVLLNGDTGLTTSSWLDQSGNGYDFTHNNSPTVTPNALNTHQIITYNGTNQNSFNNPLPIPANMTIYFVVRLLTYVSLDRYMQIGSSPSTVNARSWANEILFTCPSSLQSTTFPGVNTWTVVTLQKDSTGFGLIQINNDTPITTSSAVGVSSTVGFILAGAYLPPSGNWINADYAYFLVRSGVDSSAVITKFVNYFKNRFAI